MLVPHRGAPRVHAEPEEALHEPSLYDAVLRLPARRGHAIPEDVLRRDVSRRYEPSPEVEAVRGPSTRVTSGTRWPVRARR